MKIKILNKSAFDTFMSLNNINNDNVEEQNCFYISIVGTNGVDLYGQEEKHFFKNDLSNVLNLVFDDCEEDMVVTSSNPYESGMQIALNKEQAIKIVDFVIKNKDKNSCIVHCAAGRSRSGAVGTFINDFLEQDYDTLKKENPYIHPNGQVLSLLNRVVREMVDQFLVDYENNHSHCPKCGKDEIETTEMFCVPDPKNFDGFQDNNYAKCFVCNYTCKVHELI